MNHTMPPANMKEIDLWHRYQTTGIEIENEPVPVLYKKLHPDAVMPSHGQVGDAAVDLFTVEDVTIPARGRTLVKTGIATAIPAGYFGHIRPRSGLSLKKGLDVFAGVIDNSFRGEIGVVLYNSTDEDVVIEKGRACAQMILQAFERQRYVEVDELPPSDRSEGWGSSGR